MNAKPFFRYPGGKSRLLKFYDPYVPDNWSKYHEPFLGGGAMFFSLDLKGRESILSDMSPQLVLAYRAVRDNLSAVSSKLRTWPSTQEGFLKAKGIVNQKLSIDPADTRPLTPNEIDVATAFLVLQGLSFNGLWRVNKKEGGYNVPMDPGRTGSTLLRPDLLDAASRQLRRSTVLWLDFRSSLELVGENDFVFSDSPYYPHTKKGEERKTFTSYVQGGFTLEDQNDLRMGLSNAVSSGATVLATNAYNPKYIEAYEGNGFDVEYLYAARNISCKADQRAPVREVLYIGRPHR